METRLQLPVREPHSQMAAARRAVAEALLPRAAEPNDTAPVAGGWRVLAILLWMAAVATTALLYEITWHVAAN